MKPGELCKLKTEIPCTGLYAKKCMLSSKLLATLRPDEVFLVLEIHSTEKKFADEPNVWCLTSYGPGYVILNYLQGTQ
jgi:hypothetical protein